MLEIIKENVIKIQSSNYINPTNDFTLCLKNLSATNINSLKRLKVVNCFWMETLCNLWNLCSFMNKIINAETSA